MPYDIDQQELGQIVDASDLPEDIQSAIAAQLGDDGTVALEDNLDAEGGDVDVSGDVEIVEITGDGTYNADGQNVIIVNTDEDVAVNYNADSDDEQFVISSGAGDDMITVMDDGSGATDAVIEGGNGDDTITGASGDDSISGGDGDDSIDAGVGNDVITLGDGNDSIDGGEGFDIASVQGGRSSYNVTVNADGNIEITDADGETDVLEGVEFLQFDDGTIIAAVEDEETGTVARLYEAVFDREADSAGLNFWIDNFEQGNVTVEDIASAFLSSDEDGGTTNGLSDEAFINNLYQIFLDREGDAAGLEFYMDLLEGGVSREIILTDFAGSDEGIEETESVVVVGTGSTDTDMM